MTDSTAQSAGRKRPSPAANAARAYFLIDAERRTLVEANPAGRLLWGLGAGHDLPLPLDGAMPALVDLVEIVCRRPAKQARHDVSLPLIFWTRRGVARWRCTVSPKARRGLLLIVPDLLTAADAGALSGLSNGTAGMGLLAHEVRTPLAAIQAFADLILMTPHCEGSDQRLREHAGSIRQAAAMGLDIVSSILERDGHQPAAGSRSTDRARLDAIARDVVRTMTPLATRTGGTIACAVSPSLPSAKVDATALSQIVMNLVGNALRHAGPSPRIMIRAGKIGAQRVWIEVEDNGPGVPSSVAAVVTSREPPADGQLAGFGLRTSVSLAREHGGDLSIHTVDPHGARVRVTLDQVARPAPAKVLVSEPI